MRSSVLEPPARQDADWFDAEAADRACEFFVRFLRHTKGEWAGQPYELLPWQRDQVIRPLFGWKRADGTRKFRTAYIEIPKKNGKSTLGAGIALYLLYADREPGAEVYSAAGDRDQAAIVFETAKTMVELSKPLRRRAAIYRRSIVVRQTRSSYHVLSADVPTKHGLNPHGIIFDELHVQPTRDLWDTLTQGVAARRQPLTVALTTAGYDRESICYELHDYARKVLAGVVEDPSFFAFIAAADEQDDWQDPAIWARVNPSFGVTVRAEFFETQVRQAQQMPAKQNTFRRLHLNQWTQQVTRWIDMDLWRANAGDPPVAMDDAALAGMTCYGGLDLSSVSDLTAWVLLFPTEEPDELLVRARFWVPAARLEDTTNKYRDQYRVWAQQGFLQVMPGEAIDHEVVRDQVAQDGQLFHIVDLGIDRWQAHQVVLKLQSAGLQVAGVGMGFQSMAAPTKELERRLLARKIRHANHPVLRWCADNCAVRQDPAGNLKPDKAQSQGKIDGIVALLVALDRVMRHQASIYEAQGIRTVG